jgi:predicted PhzF superfamily epimerase YddE/YHI9
MGQTIYQADAFTSEPFRGNPAGVCLLEQARDEAWMQAVALEMNLAETAFLLPEADGWRLRWFTPTVEVDLCGHATLASAHLLYELGVLPSNAEARFYTRSGLLTAQRDPDGMLWLDFPSEPATETPAPPELLEGLGVAPRFVGANRMDLLAELESEAAVRGLTPNLTLLARLPVRGIIVTAQAEAGDYEFVSRFFAPSAGVPEDPVTGSAHCCLAPYWRALLGKSRMTGYQASARGGFVEVEVGGERVRLGGRAVTTLRGELLA